MAYNTLIQHNTTNVLSWVTTIPYISHSYLVANNITGVVSWVTGTTLPSGPRKHFSMESLTDVPSYQDAGTFGFSAT